MTTPRPSMGSLVTFTLRLDGDEIPSTVQVESVETWNHLGKVPRCRVMIFDGSAAESTFPLASGALFEPGKGLEISAGYDNRAETVIFKGLIIKQGLEIQRHRASSLVVEAADQAIRMTLERRNGVFQGIRDSELIQTLIQRHGLQAKVTRTEKQHEEIVQYYASDWDLMMLRAATNGLVVSVKAGTVEAALPDTAQDPVLAVRYGDSILDLATEMDATTQVAASSIRSTAWDPSSQEMAQSGPGRIEVTEPGGWSSERLAAVFGVEDAVQQTGGALPEADLRAWSSAELLKTRLSKIRGTVSFRGTKDAEPGKMLQLEGLGGSFDGNAYMSGVRHHLRGGSWTTTAHLGLSSRGFAAESAEVSAPLASGQVPPISGLQTGIVQQVAEDPTGGARVLVNLPLLRQTDGSTHGVWARVATFYASKEFGALFYPEVDDEVILGFMNEDPRFPVILGSVYSAAQTPPHTLTEDNAVKMLRTRSGLQIAFDDAEGILQLTTPGGCSIEMNDSARRLTLGDAHGNQGVFSSEGIVFDSPRAIELRSRGNITLDSGAHLKLSARGNATLDGNRVTARAQSTFSASGNASSKLTSSGPLTVRGATVMIN